jgi:4'-phosphopantetheinyl transferase
MAMTTYAVRPLVAANADRDRMTTKLHSRDVDLWLTFYDEITDAQLHHRYLLLLNPAEREQQKRFYFQRDRLRYLVTRALVRTVLSRYVPVEETAWRFDTNTYGRPHIANADVLAHDLRFNISHTHSLIALAVSCGREVGVDVENTSASVDLGIANHFFAAAEVAALAKVPAAGRNFRFFEYWTFKESYVKARGMGLALPLNKFSFHYPAEHEVRIEIDRELGDEAGRWQFWQLLPGAEYLVAVCAERISAHPTRLWVRRIVPGVADYALTPELTRVSDPQPALAIERPKILLPPKVFSPP